MKRPLLAALVLGLCFGTARADFYEGLAAFKNGEYSSALSKLSPLARKGNVEAQYLVARIYHETTDSLRDEARAAEWYLEAAEKGHPRAQNNLGLLYDQGRGVPADPVEAARWYRKAAEQNRAVAQYNLARLYAEGRGVPLDDPTAVRWYRRAAEQGYAKAQHELAMMYEQGRGFSQDDRKAANWYRKAARQGYAAAQLRLAHMYDDGRGVPRNAAKAAKWYGRAALRGLIEAQDRLTELEVIPPAASPPPSDVPRVAPAGPVVAEAPPLTSPAVVSPPPGASHRPGVAAPTAPTIADWRGLGDRGDAEAQYRLGRIYDTGIGALPNKKLAVDWYRAAALQGHGMAGYRLAFMYLRGEVSRHKDFARAHAWFSLSAERGVGDAEQWRDKVAKKMTPAELAEANGVAAQLASSESDDDR